MKAKRFTWHSPLSIKHYALSIMHYALCIVLLSGLSMSMTSCSDDDDDKDGRSAEEIAQDPYEKESEAGDALYRIVSQLSVCDSLPDNWKTATFEPKLGQVLDQSQPRVRTITVANAAEAVTRYNSLTGKNLPATTTSDTYSVDGVGTLTFTMGAAGTVATIDVDVKQMPQLAQLRLVSAASVGENGSFDGEPYYRFGDVVQDKEGHYWICVRPAYSPDKKEDTHWMSFQVGPKNVKTYQKSKCLEQKYPVDLGVQKEKMQYLAQLLAILANPQGYKTKAGTAGNYFNNHTTGLGGLNEAAMPVKDLITLAKLWEQYNIWDKVMPAGLDTDEVNDFKNRFKDDKDDLRFIYEKGSTSGTTLTIQTVTYNNAETFYTSLPNYTAVKMDMREVDFDITNSYTGRGVSGKKAYAVNDAFVVRYKTGFQISSNWFFNPKPTEAIEGVTEVFRFNACKDKAAFTKDEAEVGMIMAKNGKFYTSEAGCTDAKTAPVAYVVYIGNDAEASGAYRGLAMSYSESNEMKWDETESRKEVCIEDTRKNTNSWEKQNNGVSRTEKLATDGHDHPAAKWAYNFVVDGFNPSVYGFSRWFLPTVGQWLMACKGLGGTIKHEDQKEVYSVDKLDKNLDYNIRENAPNFSIRAIAWTSTEVDSKNAVYFALQLEQKTQTRIHSKEFHADVRPFIAF